MVFDKQPTYQKNNITPVKVHITKGSTVFLTGVLAFNFYLPSSVELSIVVGFPKQETKMADCAADFLSRARSFRRKHDYFVSFQDDLF